MHNNFRNKKKNQKFNRYEGFVSLLTVSIAGFAATAIGLAIILTSLSSAQSSYTTITGNKAKAMANLCAEKALNEISLNSSYAGNETITVDSESCEILPIEGTAPNLRIKTESTVDNTTRRVEIDISQVSPQISISSWKEVGEFSP